MHPRLFLSLSLFWLACSSGVVTENPIASPPALSLNPDDCASCHPKESQEWRESLHARSYTNSIFLSEFNPRRQAWCVTCHAPLAPDLTKVNDKDPLVVQGVSCASCHIKNNELVSLQKKPNSPHQTKVDQSFGDPQFCASCHQFNFPILDNQGKLTRYTDLPMQDTFGQYQKSGFSETCLDCHAATDGKHRFPGSHHLETLQSALYVSLCAKEGQLQMGVQNRGAAHNVPSGGVHRYMVLRVWRSSSPEKLFEDYIGRKFKALVEGGKETTLDTTIAPNQTRKVSVNAASLGSPEDPINLELRYIYALHEADQFPDIETSGVVWYQRKNLSEIPSCQE